ncbi:hybrid sensor histidine kinase/response regulator [Frigoriglobus tundricola]|uniref:histidine kinase n=1 Tax=Frigoriglobus tundricola TaxID=2774151 RepID=A0A6M5YME5_9BACT|nr:response regulator [Frigoriglobus tundricola]QJW95098.1 Autoinducer 2 sensor kinase/phosphatase LuxQ [Frigoriglobus tundricola]
MSTTTPGGPTGPRPPAPAEPAGAEPINILIVDDEPKNLTVLETVLNDPAYRLVRAGSADQALLALVVEEFALLILDVRMPGMTGFELAKMIKERKKTARVPIIFLTAYYNEDQHVLEGYGTGAVDYLHKPVNPAVLRSKVAVFADLHRKTREVGAANRALLAEVTERRRAEERLRELNDTLEERVAERTEALRESETRMRLAQDAARIGTFDWNVQTGAYVWTPELEAMYGLPPGGFGGTPAAWEQLLHAEDRAEAVRLVARAFETGLPVEGEWRVPWPDGSVHWLMSRFQVFKSATGAPLRMTGVNIDITRRKQAEEVLRASDRQKNEFLSMLAHELRNPLAPIRNATEVLKQCGADPGRLRWAHGVIDRQLAHLVRLVDDLLDVSRITLGKIRLSVEPTELEAVLGQAVEAVRPLVDKFGHHLEVALPPHPVHLRGDPTRLVQVFVNLLTNAAKYTEAGGHIRLAAARTDPGAEPGGVPAVRVRVRDTGIGIAPDLLPSVFDLFTQASRSLDRSQGGLGVGLTLVRRLVELHGGTVEAHSDGVGRGSEFTVTLPVPDVQGTDERPSGAERIEPRADPGPLRVVVIDDNVDGAESLADLIGLLGHEVRIAHDGAAGIGLVRDFEPDIVLLDIGLPGMDGYEVARRLRRDAATRAVLVTLSGYGREEDRTLSREAGCKQHFVKPVDLGTLQTIFSTIRPAARV